MIHRLSPDILNLSISLLKTTSPPAPISHLLLTAPGVSTWTNNPFTIADFSKEEGKVQVIIRVRNGFTKRLASLTAGSNGAQIKLPVVLEMYYGACVNYTELASQFDRLLIVAGGVGGAFAVPWLKHLAGIPGALERTRFVWAMRNTSTLIWAVRSSTSADTIRRKVEVHITSTGIGARGPEEAGGVMEMQEVRLLDNHNRDEQQEEIIVELEKWGVEKKRINFGLRPDLKGILNDVVKGGSVAVLVCGPWELGVGVKRVVGGWIRRGKNVWVHVEEFGS